MLIGTHNINGIRATIARGWHDWLARRQLSVLALQEVRCQPKDIPDWAFGDYFATCDLGSLPGRNGVAILTREAPERVRTLSGHALQVEHNQQVEVEAERLVSRGLAAYAAEGRYLEVDLAEAPIRVASLYLPKGASWPAEGDQAKPKYDRKMAFMKALSTRLQQSRREAARQGRYFLVMGDFNVANTKLDLKNWRSSGKAEGFLPEERAWFDSILGPRTLTDVVRRLNPGVAGPYSWWTWRGQAFNNDVGWRIDYHLADTALAKLATYAATDKEAEYEVRMSDHAPVVVDYRVS